VLLSISVALNKTTACATSYMDNIFCAVLPSSFCWQSSCLFCLSPKWWANCVEKNMFTHRDDLPTQKLLTSVVTGLDVM